MRSRRVYFKPKEDELIIKLKNQNPNANWSFIAKKLKGKTAKQCNDRYNKHLKFPKNDSPWTHQDDVLLAKQVQANGHNWVLISKIIGTRTNVEIKNRWSVLQRYLKIKDNDQLLIQKILETKDSSYNNGEQIDTENEQPIYIEKVENEDIGHNLFFSEEFEDELFEYCYPFSNIEQF